MIASAVRPFLRRSLLGSRVTNMRAELEAPPPGPPPPRKPRTFCTPGSFWTIWPICVMAARAAAAEEAEDVLHAGFLLDDLRDLRHGAAGFDEGGVLLRLECAAKTA